MKKLTYILAVIILLYSCRNDQKVLINYKEGKLKPTYTIQETQTKYFDLDSVTAPKPMYLQLISNDSSSNRYLTLLNNFNNSIYFYNYNDQNFVKKISFDKTGPNAVKFPEGYYIKNKDSIYIFSKLLQVLLLNEKGTLLKKKSLNGNFDITKRDLSWAFRFPEFYMSTSTPFMPRKNDFLLTGLFSGNIPDTIVEKFKYTAIVDYKLDNVNYIHNYPKELFGDNTNWGEGLFVQVFPVIHPKNQKISYSFPISHNIYTCNINGDEYTNSYAGSNSAGTIKSIDRKPEKNTPELVRSSFVRQDMYASILYDKFRDVYYRFIRKGIKDAHVDTSWKDKEIGIILMDKNFNYLGEVKLGKERIWNWQNSFITKEGLNIEYLGNDSLDEGRITFKILVPQKNDNEK